MRHRDASARSAGTQSGIPVRHTKSVGRRVLVAATFRETAGGRLARSIAGLRD